MNIEINLITLFLIPVGIWIMNKNKFYQYKTNDNLFAAKMGLFLGGFLLMLIGIWGLIDGILKLTH